MEENNAAYTDPRFSDSEERSAEKRVDQAFERSGFGLGALVALALVVRFVLCEPAPSRRAIGVQI